MEIKIKENLSNENEKISLKNLKQHLSHEKVDKSEAEGFLDEIHSRQLENYHLL